MRTSTCLAALAFVTSSTGTALGQQPFSLEDLRQLVGVSQARIAPDGATVAVVTSRPNYEENKDEPQLCAVDVASGEVRALTFGRKKVAQPEWSPVGATLAFVAPDADGKGQVWLLPIRGGEARCLTSSPTGVEHYAWRPDGAAIAFAAQDEAPELEGEAKHVRAFRVGAQDMFLDAPLRPHHLWVQEIASDAARRITSGDWSLEFALPPSSGASPLSWSKDGRRIAFARVPGVESGKLDLVRAAIADVASGEIAMFDRIDRFQSVPQFAPDGGSVVFRYPRDGRYVNFNDVHWSRGGDEAPRNLTRALDRNVFTTEWMPGGKELLVAANDRGAVGLWIQPIDVAGGPARALDLDGLVVSGAFGYDVSVAETGAIAFVATRPDVPSEVYVMGSATAKPRRLTRFNAWAAERRFAPVERITWKTEDGFEADGVVFVPRDSTTPRPLVLVIHGGPTSSSKVAFAALPQLMAAEGWVVFSPNYRGSDNLGNAYAVAIIGDAGEGPGRDVMAGIAELEKRPYVDRTRRAVTGWSYGGFMSAWLLGRYPEAWKVGVAGAPVTSWVDQYNLSDGNTSYRYNFGGSPWKAEFADAYRAQSPITHATKIRAPTLVMTNLADFRVPPTQAFGLHRALEDNGVETEFVAFPGRTHASSDPVNARERTKLWIGWVKSHLAGPAAASGTR